MFLYGYKNGNYSVNIFNDGSKYRYTEDNEFKPDFAESIDIKITNKCNRGCKYCHENSCPNGKHGKIKKLKFFKTLHSGQEIAIGGGNILEHPHLLWLLKKMKKKNVYCNITLNQYHFLECYDIIKKMVDKNLVYGVGISLEKATDDLIEKVKSIKNSVIHVINGIVTENDIEKLKNKNLKLLILGYKQKRRGENFYNENKDIILKNQKYLYDNILNLNENFLCISFDNLAVEQFDFKNRLNKDIFNKYFMGNDGCFTYYIDCVNEKFAISSTSNILYNIEDSCDTMFKKIQEITRNKS